MNAAYECWNYFFRRHRPTLPVPMPMGVAWRWATIVLTLAMAAISSSSTHHADAEEAANGSNGPMPSTIVEIQNHADRFFDQSDAAIEAFNKIGEVCEVWEAARAARARARANPDDRTAQEEYRAAQARLLYQRDQMFREALAFEEVIRQAYEAFSAQLDLEIANVREQAETERAAVDSYDSKIDEYFHALHQLRNRIDNTEHLDLEEVEVLRDVERFLADLESLRALAQERVQLVDESLASHEMIRSYAQERFFEIEDQFREAEADLLLLTEIARNDLTIVRLEQGLGDLATRMQNAPQIQKGPSLAHEVISQRQKRSMPGPLHDPSEKRINETRERADEFLRSLPARSQQETSD